MKVFSILFALGVLSSAANATSPECTVDVITQKSIVEVKRVMDLAEPNATISDFVVKARPKWEDIKETVDIVVVYRLAKKNPNKDLSDYSVLSVAQLSLDKEACTVQLWSTR